MSRSLLSSLKWPIVEWNCICLSVFTHSCLPPCTLCISNEAVGYRDELLAVIRQQNPVRRTADSQTTEKDAGIASPVIQSNLFVGREGTPLRLEFILNSAQRTGRVIMPSPPSSLPPVRIFPACRWCAWCGNKQMWCFRVLSAREWH